jgi:hypothetical protein
MPDTRHLQGNRTSATPPDPADRVFGVLLEFWADVCTVFEEYPALSKNNQHRTLGRLWESYKAARVKIDPDFNPDQFPRVSE